MTEWDIVEMDAPGGGVTVGIRPMGSTPAAWAVTVTGLDHQTVHEAACAAAAMLDGETDE